MYRLLSVLVVLVIGSKMAFALGSPDAQSVKAQKRADQTVAALTRLTDADSLAAAGVMSIGNHGDGALRLMARAVAASPDRADLVWLQALRCAQVPSCDPAPIERRLRELDPGNGAGWWGALSRAGAAHDIEGTDAALTAISHSERVDIYWTTLIAHLSRAVAKTKIMSVEESEVTVIGYMAAQALPAYQYVSTRCKGDRLQQSGATEVCRGVAKALQNGDTYLTEMIGVTIAKRVWPDGSPEWKAADDERRVYDYRSKLYPKLEQRALTHPAESLALWERNRREQDVFAAQLTAAGYDPNPPAQ
jgi:hypothetical protein